MNSKHQLHCMASQKTRTLSRQLLCLWWICHGKVKQMVGCWIQEHVGIASSKMPQSCQSPMQMLFCTCPSPSPCKATTVSMPSSALSSPLICINGPSKLGSCEGEQLPECIICLDLHLAKLYLNKESYLGSVMWVLVYQVELLVDYAAVPWSRALRYFLNNASYWLASSNPEDSHP